MRTFLSWLIANLEIAGVFILLPFQWLFIHNNPATIPSDLPMWALMTVATMFILFLGSNPTESIFGDLLNIILTLLGGYV